MTLGCGGFGGNITSDNISPRHLLNIKRLAYELRPVTQTGRSAAEATSPNAPAGPALPKAPARPAPEPIAADALTRRIDQFLSARGIGGASATPPPASPPVVSPPSPPVSPAPPVAAPAPAKPAEFVSEADVRSAVKAGEKILVGERSIITPAARDAGEAARIFTWQSYPS